MLTTKKVIYWLPRILSICFILFLSLFALDVFSEYTGWKIIQALFMHLLPGLILLVLTIIAWKRDLVGMAVFFIFAVGYIFIAGLHHHWSWYALISGPCFIVGVLFLMSWFQMRNLKKS